MSRTICCILAKLFIHSFILWRLSPRMYEKRGMGLGGLRRSGVDPPLCSSRACLHTASIVFSVPLQCNRPLLVSVPSCRSLSFLHGLVLGSLVLGINARSWSLADWA